MRFNIPLFAKSFYFISGALFIVWMLFFDSNDFMSQYRMSRKLSDLKEEKAYYNQKIQEVQQERQALLSNPQKLEKFARETYRMKKKTEDVYVVIDQE
ncbi:MAG TPA: septum formation initiator family protein [Cytophagaceae bacterium]|jgi:cell division protein DivIC|nr:septum formation initiator family protein [Cytophagaceae bacterium]